MHTMSISAALIPCVKGCELIDFEEIKFADYRGFILDMDINERFSIPNSAHDTINNTLLNPTKIVCRNRIVEKVEECMEQTHLEEHARTIENQHASKEEINQIDEAFPNAMSVA